MISLRKLFSAALLLISAPLFAQSYSAEVRGLVTDPSRAVIGGAKVTLLDETKHVSRVAVSDGAGLYVFTQVDPAGYQVIVESPGFKRFARGGIVVGTQQSVTVDVLLEIGDASQTVEVSGGTPLLDTTNGSTSTALEEEKLLDLPTSSGNGRNQYTVINVSQNVLPVIRGSGFIDQSDTSTVSIAGSPESTNQYLIDGVPITDTVNRPTIIPATEATQELKVQVTTYDAEVGRTGGGVYNTLLKSGTNSLHGSLYGVTSQSDFNANSFFFNRDGIARPDIPFYSYAGSIGGPVVIPHLTMEGTRPSSSLPRRVFGKGISCPAITRFPPTLSAPATSRRVLCSMAARRFPSPSITRRPGSRSRITSFRRARSARWDRTSSTTFRTPT